MIDLFKTTVSVNIKKIHTTEKAFDDFGDLLRKFKTTMYSDKIFDFCSTTLSYDVWNNINHNKEEIPEYVLETFGLILWLYEFKNVKMEVERVNFLLFPSIDMYKKAMDLILIIADSRNITLKFK